MCASEDFWAIDGSVMPEAVWWFRRGTRPRSAFTVTRRRIQTDNRSFAVDAALATAAAPTYFRQHITQHDVGLLDGGVWANNPVAIAAVEAIGVLGWPRESLHILSLGCLEETYRSRNGRVKPDASFCLPGLHRRRCFSVERALLSPMRNG